MDWSPQQTAGFDWIEQRTGSALMPAVAGAGKTTFLVEGLRRIVARAAGRRVSVAFCAYNRAIAEEIKPRVAGLLGVRVSTFHGFGMGTWMKANEGCQLAGERGLPPKVPTILTELEVPEEYHKFATELVSLAKAHAIGVLTPFDNQEAWHRLIQHHELDQLLTDNPELLDDHQMGTLLGTGLAYAQRALRRSVELDRTVIDYDDMIYAPLVHNARFWQNDWVLVDEAQDTNPARRCLARKMLRPGGRLIAVGDPHQAIYGFTGADADAFELIGKEFGCTRLPLTTTYRCPKAVVRHAQQWVNHIQAADAAPEGEVRTLPKDAFDKLGADVLTAQAAVLCRNTKPLVEAAYALIRRGIGCHVEGRDIGRGLLSLACKWKIKSLSALTARLLHYKEREVARLVAKKQEQAAQSVEDKVDTLLVIIGMLTTQGATTIDALRDSINKLFDDVQPGKVSNNLTLSTVHKAKGREWDTVYLLGRNAYMPSKYARQEWQLEQERNLMYVAVTRAKRSLVEVTV